MTRISLALVTVLLAACGGHPAPVTPASPPPAAPVATAPAELTTVDQVMEASIAAEGGRAALGKLTSLKLTGTVEIAGIKGSVVIVAAPPREILRTITLAQLGTIVSGTHGDLSWEQTPMTGARVLSGPELAATLRRSTFNADLAWKTLNPTSKFDGIVDYKGERAYKIELTSTDGEVETRYVSVATHRQLATESTQTTQMGKVPVSLQQRDFRAVGDLTFPFSLVNTEAGQTFTVTVTSIEPNAVIDPAVFEPSADIKKLAAHGK